MTAKYLFIQGVGLIGTVLFFVSFQCRKNQSLFRVQFLSYLFYMTHLMLLGAMTGGISYIINTFRSACLGSNWKFAHRKSMCAIICAMQIATLIFTWSGWVSIFPIAANISATIAGYTHDARKLRIINMVLNSPLWIVYDILVGSWAGILDEAVSEASMLVSFLRYGWNGLGAGKQEAR